MAQTTTMTVSLPPETTAQLAELADRTHRPTSALAAEAITDYVARELVILASIERGLDDVKAGRVSTHADVMTSVQAIIESARTQQ